MTKPLDQRLQATKFRLDQVVAALGRHPGALAADVGDGFRDLARFGDEIPHWLELIRTRDASAQLLAGLEGSADGDDCVPLGMARVKYQHVRLIGVQARLSTSWALADRISAAVGGVFCTPNSGSNVLSPPQMISHFIGKDRKKTTAAGLYRSIQRTFGWPIGISYALRNHFVHDGGFENGADFFEGVTAASGFRISSAGWDRVEERAREKYGVAPTFVRGTWPAAPCDDLRAVLVSCEREMDDAMGVLIGSAAEAIFSHVGYMLGDD